MGIYVMHSEDTGKDISDCSPKFHFCEHYIYGKQNHVSFPSKAT